MKRRVRSRRRDRPTVPAYGLRAHQPGVAPREIAPVAALATMTVVLAIIIAAAATLPSATRGTGAPAKVKLERLEHFDLEARERPAGSAFAFGEEDRTTGARRHRGPPSP